MLNDQLYPEIPDGLPTEQLQALCRRWSTFRVQIRRDGDLVTCQAGTDDCRPKWSSPIKDGDVQAARQRAAKHAVDYWRGATIRAH
ncbi:MAG: hypothetical protein INF91_04775 [Alphaproteobacteria bacterium]|nr:hypothetical protein [Alphaproteobacteria bacterium]